MTDHVKIHGVIPRTQYVGNGVLTMYEFPFAIFSADDIEVYLNDTKQSSTSYSVSGVRNSDGGSVTFATAPANGTIITIVRNLSIERTSDFQEGGTLRADTLNDEFDYQIACQQQMADKLNRTMTLPAYAVQGDVDFSMPLPSPGKAIVWSADGKKLEASTVAVNDMKSTLEGYKTAAESAASTATTKAGIASDKADIATNKAQLASDKADVATAKAAEADTILSSKANKDADNLTAIGKKKLVNLVMPSNQYVDLTLSTSGQSFIAPASGYFNIRGVNMCVSLYNATSNMFVESQTGYSPSCCLPVQQGDQIDVYFTGNIAGITWLRFVYAQGEI